MHLKWHASCSPGPNTHVDSHSVTSACFAWCPFQCHMADSQCSGLAGPHPDRSLWGSPHIHHLRKSSVRLHTCLNNNRGNSLESTHTAHNLYTHHLKKSSVQLHRQGHRGNNLESVHIRLTIFTHTSWRNLLTSFTDNCKATEEIT